MTEGQQALLNALHAAIDNSDGSFTAEQKHVILQALYKATWMPLTFDDAVNVVLTLDDVGLDTTSKAAGEMMTAVLEAKGY